MILALTGMAKTDQSPLGRTLQLLRTLHSDGRTVRMDAFGRMAILSGRVHFVFSISGHASVIPKPRVFSSGARDLPAIRVGRGLVLIPPIFSQIIPSWIYGFDQPRLLASPPTLNFLFAIDRGIGADKPLVVDQLSQVVAARKAGDQFVLMLPDRAWKVSRHT